MFNNEELQTRGVMERLKVIENLRRNLEVLIKEPGCELTQKLKESNLEGLFNMYKAVSESVESLPFAEGLAVMEAYRRGLELLNKNNFEQDELRKLLLEGMLSLTEQASSTPMVKYGIDEDLIESWRKDVSTAPPVLEEEFPRPTGIWPHSKEIETSIKGFLEKEAELEKKVQELLELHSAELQRLDENTWKVMIRTKKNLEDKLGVGLASIACLLKDFSNIEISDSDFELFKEKELLWEQELFPSTPRLTDEELYKTSLSTPELVDYIEKRRHQKSSYCCGSKNTCLPIAKPVEMDGAVLDKDGKIVKAWGSCGKVKPNAYGHGISPQR